MKRTPIEKLKLKTKTTNVLKKAKIENIEQLQKLSLRDLLKIKGLGQIMAEEILTQLLKLT